MDDHARGEDRRADVPELPQGESAEREVEAYETVDGIVLYDGDNPLAWIQSTAVESLSENR
ncbi:MAG: hypothetical protein ABEJ84_00240 [Halodesulfurarchaeum sp.]